MKYKKSLLSIIVMSLLITGCSLNKAKNEEKSADSITKQKTMTKVQNNVNEIIDKDYNYVIQNMGEPYRTFYYIDVKDINKLKHVDELTDVNKLINENSNMILTYPKNTYDLEIDKSALYISLKNNHVIDVETREFNENINEEVLEDSYIVVDNFKKGKKLFLNNVEKFDFSRFTGKNIDVSKEIIGNTNSDFEIYDRNTEIKISGYLLKDENEKNRKALIILEHNEIIKKMIIIDKNISVGEIFKLIGIK